MGELRGHAYFLGAHHQLAHQAEVLIALSFAFPLLDFGSSALRVCFWITQIGASLHLNSLCFVASLRFLILRFSSIPNFSFHAR